MSTPAASVVMSNEFSLRKSIVFIDTDVTQPETLAQGVIPGSEVHLLNQETSALSQISILLSGRSDVGSVHIISHGAPGRLLLSNSELNLANLDDHTAQLETWFASSTDPSPQLLLYGCKVAAGEAGAAFLAKLEAVVGANVVAASQPVGATKQGSQWKLDWGNITTPLAISAATQASYTGVFEVNLDPGDLAVVGYGSDAANDYFAIAALTEIPANSVLFFTDRGWNGTALESNGETTREFTVGSTAIPAGTILTRDNLTSFGSVAGNVINLAAAGDQLLIYQTADGQSSSAPTFIYALNNNDNATDANGWQADASTGNVSAVPGNLAVVTSNGDGNTAFARLTQADNGKYVGPTTGTQQEILAAISDPANWTTSDDISGQPTFFDSLNSGFTVSTIAPGITVSALSGPNTTEDLGSTTFTVVLDTEPSADVTVDFTSSNPAEGTVTSQVVFTSADWDQPKTITITGVDDSAVDGSVAYDINAAITSNDTDYAALAIAPIAVTNLDNDAGFVSTPPSGTTTTEEAGGGTVTFDLSLSTAPSDDVTVNFTSSDITEGIVTSPIVFDSSNWDQAQTVTITGIDDSDSDGPIAYSVTPTVTSNDATYGSLTLDPIALVNLDNEPGFLVTNPVGTGTTEAGGTVSFDLSLSTEPTADVTVSLISSDPTEGVVTSPATVNNGLITSEVVFNSTNWNQPQTVTITGVDDDIDDGDQQYTITATVNSDDSTYANLNLPNNGVVPGINADDDTAAVTLTPISGNTTEAGGTANFTAVLGSEPTADITLNFTSDDSTEGTVTPTITFNATNWQTPQAVTVTGVSDNEIDGDQAYNIQYSISSNDTIYAGLSSTTVAVTNLDSTPVATANDFDQDGTSEILWRNQGDSSILMWNVQNNSVTGSATINANEPDLAWVFKGTADFNQDGNLDLISRNNTTGAIKVSRLDSNRQLLGETVPVQPDSSLGLEWELVAVEDFNQDQQADVLWRHQSTGQLIEWHLGGSPNSSSPNNFQVPAISSTALDLSLIGEGTEGVYPDLGWKVEASGDFNGDGKGDIVWRHQEAGQVSIWQMDNGTLIGGYVLDGVADNNWKILGSGDFNGDGKADLAWQHQGDGAISLWNLDQGTVIGGDQIGAVATSQWRNIV